jgi:Fe2+ or Zn2+ uptake regulation protein
MHCVGLNCKPTQCIAYVKMPSANVPTETDKPSTYGWLQLEKKAAKELQSLAIRSPAAMGTLLYMVNHMGRSNALVVSQKTMAESLGISLKSVGNSVKLLTEHHFIEAIKVGNMTVYKVNSRVAWQGHRGARFAHFGAEVVAMENEQAQPIDDLPALKQVPVLHEGERLLVGNEQTDPPDQGELELP